MLKRCGTMNFFLSGMGKKMSERINRSKTNKNYIVRSCVCSQGFTFGMLYVGYLYFAHRVIIRLVLQCIDNRGEKQTRISEKRAYSNNAKVCISMAQEKLYPSYTSQIGNTQHTYTWACIHTHTLLPIA